MVCCGVFCYCAAWYSVVEYGMVWCGLVWCGVVWYVVVNPQNNTPPGLLFGHPKFCTRWVLIVPEISYLARFFNANAWLKSAFFHISPLPFLSIIFLNFFFIYPISLLSVIRRFWIFPFPNPNSPIKSASGVLLADAAVGKPPGVPWGDHSPWGRQQGQMSAFPRNQSPNIPPPTSAVLS